MAAKLKKWRELRIALRALMASRPRDRELISIILGMNQLLVEALTSIVENQVNAEKASAVLSQAKAVLVDHEKRLRALEGGS